MAVHWFAWLCFAAAIVAAMVLLRIAREKPHPPAEVAFFVLFLSFIAGLISVGLAGKQNNGLAARNTRYFKAQGYKVLSAYGHKVCVAAGPHKLCLQERKDATGKKQLVLQQADDSWIVIHGPGSGFMDALSHAPSN